LSAPAAKRAHGPGPIVSGVLGTVGGTDEHKPGRTAVCSYHEGPILTMRLRPTMRLRKTRPSERVARLHEGSPLAWGFPACMGVPRHYL
jgi:hypothetical protein